MAYVYKHTRIDNDEIFYIGIGSDENEGYKRANVIYGRNRWWKMAGGLKFKFIQ